VACAGVNKTAGAIGTVARKYQPRSHSSGLIQR
jgi:hypothetical protein